jgi:hypothetical protein
MLTLEVYGKFITWHEEFAVLMMEHYQKNGVPFIVHRNCVHAGRDTTVGNTFITKLAGSAEAQEYFCCCHLT